MDKKHLFLNDYYFNISQEKEHNKTILNHFLYNTDYDKFYINTNVIALSLFTDYKNYRNDKFDLKEYELINNIIEDFSNGKDSEYTITRKELKTIIKLSNRYRLSTEDNEKIIKGFVKHKKEYQKYLDILLEINKQI